MPNAVNNRINFILSLTGLRLAETGLKRLAARMNALGAQARNAGLAFAAVATGMTMVVADTISVFKSFDDQLRTVQARIAGITPKQIAALREEAARLGRTTSFTAEQVGDLMVKLATAGMSADEIRTVTKDVLNLARATGSEGALAARTMTEVLSQFQMAASEAGHVANVLTFAVNNSNQVMDDLAESMKFAGAISNELGYSLEQTTADLMVLADAGLRGTLAGNALKRLATIAASSKNELKDVFDIDVIGANGKVKALTKLIGEFDQKTKQLDPADRIKKFEEFFGLLGITGGALLAKNAKEAEKLAFQLKWLTGTAQDTADVMEDGIGGTLRRIYSAFEGLRLMIGELFSTELNYLVAGILNTIRAVQDFATDNAELLKSFFRMIPAIAGIAAALIAISGALATFGFVASTLASVVTLISAVVSALIAIATPAGVLAVALVSIALAMQDVFIDFGEWVERMKTAWANAMADMAKGWDVISKAMHEGDIESAFKAMTITMKLAWIDTLSGLFGGIISFYNKLGQLFAKIQAMFYRMTSAISEDFDKLWVALGRMSETEAQFRKAQNQAQIKVLDNMSATTFSYDVLGKMREDLLRELDVLNDGIKTSLAAKVRELQKVADRVGDVAKTIGRNFYEMLEEGQAIQQKQAYDYFADLATKAAMAAKNALPPLDPFVTKTVEKGFSSGGSGSAASLRQAIAKNAADLAQKQLNEQKKTNDILDQILQNAENGLGSIWGS